MAGLHLEHHARIGGAAVVLSPALPVGRYPLMVYLLHTLLLSAAVLLAAAGVGTAVCLLVVMIAPFVTVVGHETVGHRHQRRMLRDLGTG
ncbi:hypothetical protein ACFUN7_05605 [Streptomyces sp. NPDC057236]|uniref:hypothetical protein n=1 Tax=Streptomyces sp. NPDC057236 TaxID=3346059 RepID=UPI00363FB2A3